MNIGPYQILFLLRPILFDKQPEDEETRALGLFKHIYKWIVYVWPIEIRKFRRP